MSLSALDVILGWVKKNLCYGKAPTLEADLRKADAELTTLREQAAWGPRYGLAPKQMPGGTVPVFLGHFGNMDGWWSRTPKGRPTIYRQWGPNAGGGWETRSGFASGAPGVHDMWEAACKYGLPDEPPAGPGELAQAADWGPRYGVPDEPAVWLGRYGDVDLWLRYKDGDQEVSWQNGLDQGWVWRPRQNSGLAERQEAWRRVDALGLPTEPPAGPGELEQVAGHAKRLGVAILMNSCGDCWTLADGDWYAPGLKGDLLTPKCTAVTLLSELGALPKEPEQPKQEQETLVEVAVEMRRLLDLGAPSSEWDRGIFDRLDAAIAREREAK